MRTSLGVVLLVASIAGGTAATAFAQEASPKTSLRAPDPSLCDIEPRSAEDLERATAEPVANGTAGAAEAIGDGPPVLPEGPPPDAEAAAAATAVVEERLACVNANEHLRAFALLTDRALAAELAGSTAKELAFFREPAVPAAKGRWRAFAVREAVVLADGRVGLLVESAGLGGAATDLTILVEAEGRYLIDEEIGIAPIPEQATPPTP